MIAFIASVKFSVPVSELKEFAVQTVISSFVAARAGADLSAFEAREITVRGRAEAMAVHLITLRAICPRPRRLRHAAPPWWPRPRQGSGIAQRKRGRAGLARPLNRWGYVRIGELA